MRRTRKSPPKGGCRGVAFSVETAQTAAVKPRKEELLYFLLWSLDQFMNPTWRNLNGTFESWAWRNGLGRRLEQLARDQLVERRPEPGFARVIRLTEAGRALALGGRDPEERWARPWDGKWRLVVFDVPERERRVRVRVWRTLRAWHFGHLQDSVWVTPDAESSVLARMKGCPAEPRSLVVLEAQLAAGERDADLVAAAWDFDAINRRYEALERHLERVSADAARRSDWFARERAAWDAAVRSDPLLPRELCPRGYRGPEVWRRRRQILSQLAASAFSPGPAA